MSRKIEIMLALLLTISGTASGAGAAAPAPAWRSHVEVLYQADSLDALIARAKPSFSWGDGDMIWINEPGPGRIVITLNRAIRVPDAPRNDNRRLLVRPRGDIDYVPILDGQFVYERMEVTSAAPESDEAPPSHALMFGADPELGTLYRVRWTSGPTTADPANTQVRDLFLLKRGDRWRFVGEGPTQTFGRGERGTWFSEGIHYRLEWLGHQDRPINLSATHWRMQAEDADLPSRPDLIIRRDGIIDLARREMRWDPHEYLLATAEESIDTLIERLTAWRTWPAWRRLPERRPALLNLVRPQVMAINRDLPRDGVLAAGTRVYVPSKAATDALLEGSPATRPAGGEAGGPAGRR